MDTSLIIPGIIFGLSIGSIYFLMAIGLSLCFGLMRVISLDQLLYYSVGGYITYTISLYTGSFWLGVLAAVVVGGIVSLAIERIVFRRIYERDLTFSMITSFGVLLGGVGIIKFFWGLIPRPVPVPINAQLNILGTDVPIYRLVVIFVAIAVYIAIWLFLNRTIIGKAIRAGIESPDQVQGLGINIRRIFTITFVVASGLAGFGGCLHSPLVGVRPYMGFDMLLLAFITVILGGLGSLKGTLISAAILGQVISVGGTLYSPLSSVGPFLVMFIVILLKPTGLYGIKGKAFGFEE